ncbi:hypothetical protein L3X38_006117 [Prunus dulcis]|uniref:Uncharacterized protein n=1 Tax=Prunus dulcis TaxID=3755 RepID=A0AAD5F4S9_PRUDU|nr:hypothetical protein L3X38_006117 [Prunus dulcis]
MSILDRRPIESALPTLARPIIGNWKTLGAQRAGLEDMLKEMKRKDDILPKLMTSTGSYEDLLKNNYCCKSRPKMMSLLPSSNLEDYKASREKCYKQIQAAIANYSPGCNNECKAAVQVIL